MVGVSSLCSRALHHRADAEVDCTLSGSTAVMVVSYLDRLYIGNVVRDFEWGRVS
jgi:hypothetical protein